MCGHPVILFALQTQFLVEYGLRTSYRIFWGIFITFPRKSLLGTGMPVMLPVYILLNCYFYARENEGKIEMYALNYSFQFLMRMSCFQNNCHIRTKLVL